MVASNTRYVSQLTKDSLALILAGGKGSRLHELTEFQAKPALHFGGKFRVIDFPLSNCVNSGIKQIGVVTQYKSRSLLRHLVQGWGHLNNELGEFVELLPASQQLSSKWYQGTADALYQNIDFIREHAPKYVLVLSGDQVYKMDYGDLLAHHVESQADMTVSCIELPIEEAAGTFGVMQVTTDYRIINFQEKPEVPHELVDRPGFTLASMGNYVFNTEFLIEQLCQDAGMPGSQHDFGHDLIPRLITTSKIYASRFRNILDSEVPYWRDVGSLDSFWQANMDLIDITPKLNVYDEEWPIWTHQKQHPPAKFIFNDDDRRGYAVDSMVAGGCIVSGSKIDRSLLFSDVKVHSYSEIFESVILPHVDVGRHVTIHRAIIENGCKIPDGFKIGIDKTQDLARGFRVTDSNIVLVTVSMLTQLALKESTEKARFPLYADETQATNISGDNLLAES